MSFPAADFPERGTPISSLLSNVFPAAILCTPPLPDLAVTGQVKLAGPQGRHRFRASFRRRPLSNLMTRTHPSYLSSLDSGPGLLCSLKFSLQPSFFGLPGCRKVATIKKLTGRL